MRARAATRQRAAMAEPAVAAEVHEPLDVHRHFAAQVAFDLVVAVDGLTDLQHFRVGQLVDAALGRDADLVDDLLGELLANAVNVLKRNDDALVGRNVDAQGGGVWWGKFARRIWEPYSSLLHVGPAGLQNKACAALFKLPRVRWR